MTSRRDFFPMMAGDRMTVPGGAKLRRADRAIVAGE